MRKTLAAAAACAAASAACAQSSVTLFGVVDAAIAYTTGSGPASSSKWQVTNSSNTFSRLGFRGTEDLGGGYAAGFWLEAGLQNDTGAGYLTNIRVNGLVLAVPIADVLRYLVEQRGSLLGADIRASKTVGHVDLGNRQANDQRDSQNDRQITSHAEKTSRRGRARHSR